MTTRGGQSQGDTVNGKGTPCIVGMVQVPPLPGSARYRGEKLTVLLERTVAEASLLADCGFHGVQVQNMGDSPSGRRVGPETVAYMTLICHEIARACPELSISVLVNWDAEASLAVGHACDADFVRVEHTYIGVSVTSWGLSQACCRDATAFRSRIGADLPIFADLLEPHAVPLVQRSVEELAKAAVFEGAADGLFVTGASLEDSLALIQGVRRATVDVPVWLGGGATASNVASFLPYVDGVTVATSIKRNGDMANPVEPELAAAFIRAATPPTAATVERPR